MAGKTIGEVPGRPGVVWRGVLEGIQADQDFLRVMFDLQRTASHQLHCHFCDSIQWVSTRSEIGPLNNVESLYTVFGPREGDATKLGNITFITNDMFHFFYICDPSMCVFDLPVVSSWVSLYINLGLLVVNSLLNFTANLLSPKLLALSPHAVWRHGFDWPPKQLKKRMQILVCTN